MREVIAGTLEELDDERLDMVTVTGIDVDPDFSRAVVFYSAMFTSSHADDVQEAFDEHRVRLQAAVGSEVRLKRTPLLSFRPDPAITAGQRIDELLRDPQQPTDQA
jgi:ribosome-binding factor A